MTMNITTLELLRFSKQIYKKGGHSFPDWTLNNSVNIPENGLAIQVYNREDTFVIVFGVTNLFNWRKPLENAHAIVNIVCDRLTNIIDVAHKNVCNIKNLTEAKQKSNNNILQHLHNFLSSSNSHKVYLTGYSLGGYLAEAIGAYLIVTQEQKNVYIKTFEHLSCANVLVPYFSSKNCLEKFQENNAKYTSAFKNQITTYLCSPNLVNTKAQHLGTIYHIHFARIGTLEKSLHALNCIMHDIMRVMFLCILCSIFFQF